MTRLHKILIEKIKYTIQKYDLIQPNDRILVGVSGGKDSFALWQLMGDIHKAEGKYIEFFAKEQQFPVLKNPCRISGKSKREKVKEIIKNLETENGSVKDSIFQSLFHINTDFLPKP